MKIKKSSVIGIPSICISIMMFAASIFYYLQSNKLLENSVQTIGQVVDVIEKKHGVKKEYVPIISFRDFHWNYVEFESVRASKRVNYEIDQKVNIVYKATNPKIASIMDFGSLWLTSFSLALAGAVQLIYGYMVVKKP